jgi:hypothetical protein
VLIRDLTKNVGANFRSPRVEVCIGRPAKKRDGHGYVAAAFRLPSVFWFRSCNVYVLIFLIGTPRLQPVLVLRGSFRTKTSNALQNKIIQHQKTNRHNPINLESVFPKKQKTRANFSRVDTSSPPTSYHFINILVHQFFNTGRPLTNGVIPSSEGPASGFELLPLSASASLR